MQHAAEDPASGGLAMLGGDVLEEAAVFGVPAVVPARSAGARATARVHVAGVPERETEAEPARVE